MLYTLKLYSSVCNYISVKLEKNKKTIYAHNRKIISIIEKITQWESWNTTLNSHQSKQSRSLRERLLCHEEKKQNEHIYKASQIVHHKWPRLMADLVSGLMIWIYSFILLKRKTEKSVCHKINKPRVKNRFPQTNSGW